jgi:tRNA(fMet)-specific endonuclease VapC
VIVLDTDHMVEFVKGTSQESLRLQARLENCAEDFSTTIVTAEELTRGWLAEIRRVKDLQKQILPYARLEKTLATLGSWKILPWNEPAVQNIQSLRRLKLKIGTMDLKIASIALAHTATLLTRNAVDFVRVPGLAIDDWLSP